MQLGEQLLLELIFRQRRHRYVLARRGVLARIEVEGQDALSLDRYAGKFRGLEAPLFRRLECGVAEQRVAVDDPRADHFATLVDRDLDLNCAFCACSFGYRRVSRLSLSGRATLQDAAGDFDSWVK